MPKYIGYLPSLKHSFIFIATNLLAASARRCHSSSHRRSRWHGPPRIHRRSVLRKLMLFRATRGSTILSREHTNLENLSRFLIRVFLSTVIRLVQNQLRSLHVIISLSNQFVMPIGDGSDDAEVPEAPISFYFESIVFALHTAVTTANT